jgi:3-deoxy-D-arabino-heptulosonate 7-phosphate (DAHP) synthase
MQGFGINSRDIGITRSVGYQIRWEMKRISGVMLWSHFFGES